MFYFDGLSYAEIAERTNRRVRLVEYEIYWAKRKIWGFLSKSNKEEKHGCGN